MKRSNKALLIKVDGTIKIVTPKRGNNFSLEELQGYVEGLIDIVYYPNDKDMIMIVNDEGLFDKKYNLLGSIFLTEHYGKECCIHGDVLICKDNMVK